MWLKLIAIPKPIYLSIRDSMNLMPETIGVWNRGSVLPKCPKNSMFAVSKFYSTQKSIPYFCSLFNTPKNHCHICFAPLNFQEKLPHENHQNSIQKQKRPTACSTPCYFENIALPLIDHQLNHASHNLLASCFFLALEMTFLQWDIHVCKY